jgi:hypothetical protein
MAGQGWRELVRESVREAAAVAGRHALELVGRELEQAGAQMQTAARRAAEGR